MWAKNRIAGPNSYSSRVDGRVKVHEMDDGQEFQVHAAIDIKITDPNPKKESEYDEDVRIGG